MALDVARISGAGKTSLVISKYKITNLFRSVHNTRIERLWVDVTAKVGSSWAQHFGMLEIEFDLDVNNARHIWLLHYLFLPCVNEDLMLFVGAWNNHKIRMMGRPRRSPLDMFCFDMYACGLRGDELPLDEDIDLTWDGDGHIDTNTIEHHRLNLNDGPEDASYLP